jgi:hypothetical protein
MLSTAGTLLTFINVYFRQLPVLQECTNPLLHGAVATKFCTMVRNILRVLSVKLSDVTIRFIAVKHKLFICYIGQCHLGYMFQPTNGVIMFVHTLYRTDILNSFMLA